MEEEKVTPFQRCHFEPSAFVHVCSPRIVKENPGRVVYANPNEVPQRIVCTIYVDDGRTWDNCNTVCDDFYLRMSKRFSLTCDGGGLTFMIGMDIALGDGWAKLSSSTYIRSMCTRWLPHAIEEYDHVDTSAHPRLMDYYEQAILLRGNTPPELGHRYRSLVGGLLFPCPVTRPDCLYAAGIHARAMDFATEDLFKTALHLLVFMGQAHSDGLLYSRHAPNARQLEWWSDSDWSVRRSTTGGTGQLAGASVCAMSRRQECITGSSTHAEIVAASSNSNDVLWARGFLEEIGLPQLGPTPFYVDAKNVLTLVYNLISSKLTWHINRRELIVREREIAGELEVTKVATEDNISDMLTKGLDRVPFVKLRRLLMNLVVRAPSAVVPRLRRQRQS